MIAKCNKRIQLLPILNFIVHRVVSEFTGKQVKVMARNLHPSNPFTINIEKSVRCNARFEDGLNGMSCLLNDNIEVFHRFKSVVKFTFSGANVNYRLAICVV